MVLGGARRAGRLDARPFRGRPGPPKQGLAVEQAIIGVIVLGALGLTFYKVFVRPSCSCGCGGKKKHKKCPSLAEGLQDD